MVFSWWARSIGLVVAVGVAAVLSTLYSFNHFSKVETDIPGSCSPVIGIAGPEDIQINRATKRAFIASFDRVSDDAGRGAIHLVPIDDPLDASGWRDRTKGKPAAFEPISVSHFEEGDVKRLFVVNAAVDAVELYDVLPSGDLRHLETFNELRMTSPKSVVATGIRSFYVSNDLSVGRASPLGRLQYLVRAGGGNILYFNGVSWREVVTGLRVANGLAMSADGKEVYVTEGAGMALKVFDRDQRTANLTLRQTTPLPGAPDNINLQADGSLLIAINPKPLTIALHRRRPEMHSPSLIMQINKGALMGGGVEAGVGFQTLFKSSGEELSAATVADRIGDKMLIGAMVEDRFLICDL